MSDVLLAFGAFLGKEVYAPRTIRGYLEDLRQYERWLISQGLSEDEILLTEESLRRYFRVMEEKGVSSRGKSRIMTALHAFERFQKYADHPDGVPGEVARAGHNSEPALNAPRKNLRALIKEFGSQQGNRQTERQIWLAARNQAIFRVLQGTTLHAGEVCELRVESDTSGDNLEILHEIFPGVELSANTRQALLDWLKLRKSEPGLLFMNYSGEPMRPYQLYQLTCDMRLKAKMYGTSEKL